MKRFAPILSLLILLLCGCSFLSAGNQDSVMFYYPCFQFRLGQADGAIAAEERDGTGHITDLDYLLRLYLAGPHREDLISPFPENVQLSDVRTGQNKVTVTLTGSPDGLAEVNKNLACACLTLTCLEMTKEESVMIFWGDEIIIMDQSCLTLFDESAPIPE